LKVIRRASIARVGGFEAAVSGVQDWVMALEIAEFGRFGYLPEPLYNYRVHSNTVTQTDMAGQLWRANVVRRRFAERYFRTRGAGRFGEGAASASGADASRALHLPGYFSEDLRRYLHLENVTSADLGRLREFNGGRRSIVVDASGVGYFGIWLH
jgi:O-antigen biosynthesis protein